MNHAAFLSLYADLLMRWEGADSECRIGMNIQEWKRKLKGAEPDGWCVPDVRCEICHRVLIDFGEIWKSRRPEATYY